MAEEAIQEQSLPVPVEQVQPTEMTPLTEAVKVEVLGRIKGAITVAKDFPRDEASSLGRILTACANKGLADKAVYRYPRGGETISGPSIRLAEAMAQRWTNLDFGVREISQRDGYSVVEAYCWDLETNVRQTRTFTVKHEIIAKKKVKRLSDPRDIYEHIANLGARRMRACILSIIPKEITDAAVHACQKASRGNDTRDIKTRTAEMLAAFEKLGVKEELISKRLKHDPKHINEDELQDLREIWTSMSDNQSRRSDWFDVPEESSASAEDLTERLQAKAELKVKKSKPKEELTEDEKLPFEKEEKNVSR